MLLQPVSLRVTREKEASRDAGRAVWGLFPVERDRQGPEPGSQKPCSILLLSRAVPGRKGTRRC